MATVIRPLARSDDRTRVVTGRDDLDEWFHLYAGTAHFRKRLCRVFVALDDATEEIVGFVALATKDFPGPLGNVHALLIARLGVSQTAQRKGIGFSLLFFCLSEARRLADTEGYDGVMTEAKPGAEAFYLANGFGAVGVRTTEGRATYQLSVMFLPMEKIP